MSDASGASDAVSTPLTVFSRVAANAAWKRLNRLMPALAAAVILAMGFVLIAVTPAGHIPDVWAHTYRIDGIVNGDVLARPVDSTSILHSGSGNVGGCVSHDWIQFSIDHYDGYDPAAVNADFLERHGTGSTAAGSGANSASTANTTCVDTPYNNAAVNSPVAYLPQLAAFAIGTTATLTPRHHIRTRGSNHVAGVRRLYVRRRGRTPPLALAYGPTLGLAAVDLPLFVRHLGRFHGTGAVPIVHMSAVFLHGQPARR